jgi:hypothetical protein
MLRLLLLFVIPSIPVQAMELLRDRHESEEYVFEADQTEMTATVDAAGATVRATDWATHFYKDLLHIENCDFRDKPTRFWLITFARSNGEKVYAAVLPDGTIVAPYIDAELKRLALEPCAAGTEEQPEKKS